MLTNCLWIRVENTESYQHFFYKDCFRRTNFLLNINMNFSVCKRRITTVCLLNLNEMVLFARFKTTCTRVCKNQYIQYSVLVIFTVCKDYPITSVFTFLDHYWNPVMMRVFLSYSNSILYTVCHLLSVLIRIRTQMTKLLFEVGNDFRVSLSEKPYLKILSFKIKTPMLRSFVDKVRCLRASSKLHIAKTRWVFLGSFCRNRLYRYCFPLSLRGKQGFYRIFQSYLIHLKTKQIED